MATRKKATKNCSNDFYCVSQIGSVQPTTNFHKDSRSTDGLKAQCKECRLSSQYTYYSDGKQRGVSYVKRLANQTLNNTEAKAVAYNYLAKDLNVDTTRVTGLSVERSYANKIRTYLKNTFFTTKEKAAVFNLISYQLGQRSRVRV